jgi:CheY-like chemotaxis protein
MRPKNPVSEPFEVAFIDGEVVFLGDGAVNFSMTVPAATATLRRLAQTLLLAPVTAAGSHTNAQAATVVLLVEHEPLLRELGATVLQDAGYKVIEAAGAADAIKALEAAKVNVLFTDIQIPGDLDGLALAHLVSQRWPTVRLLICSGRLQPEAGALPSAGKFMRKPYGLDEMLATVGELAAV